ncbi:MAG TPA: SDR family oxidoreductase [Pseudogracilibacillus sp.]|nr:SDR family oxidoreductase [Pseudogracilibacillus sp.]
MKTIVITGASTGIGEAIAKKLAENDYRVILVARNKERLEKVTKEINEMASHSATFYQVDVSSQSQVEDMVNDVKDKFGSIYGYINNAGVMLDSEVVKGNVTSWEQMIDVNIKGVLYGTSLVIPDMIENGAGHIINISSVSGHEVTKKSTVYSATKFAVRAISQGLEKELARTGVRITNISPGMVDTNLSPNRQEMNRKPLEAVDIANGVLYALSQPNYVNVNELTIRPN